MRKTFQAQMETLLNDLTPEKKTLAEAEISERKQEIIGRDLTFKALLLEM